MFDFETAFKKHCYDSEFAVAKFLGHSGNVDLEFVFWDIFADLYEAPQHSHLEALKWIFEEFKLDVNDDLRADDERAFRFACYAKDLNTMKWIWEASGKTIDIYAYHEAQEDSSIPTYISRHYDGSPEWMEILEWLHGIAPDKNEFLTKVFKAGCEYNKIVRDWSYKLLQANLLHNNEKKEASKIKKMRIESEKVVHMYSLAKEKFLDACRNGDLDKAKELYAQDPDIQILEADIQDLEDLFFKPEKIIEWLLEIKK